MSILYRISPVCVSLVRSNDYIAYANGWQDHPHHYYKRSYMGIDLLHLKYIKRR